MAFDGFASGTGRRRGFHRAAGLLCLILLVPLLALGCGERGNGAETDPEKGADAAILNEALARELTLLALYTQGGESIHGSLASVRRQFRTQQQEYANAINKVLRGLGGRAEAEPRELEPRALKGRRDFLVLAYELESAALASYLEQVPRLYTPAPRTLAASLAAAHAQHLVLIRQDLGAGGVEAVPEAFDGGEVPAPGAASPGGG